MTKSVRNWWIGGAIVVVLIALITWAGMREEPPQAIVGTAVVVVSPPVSGRASMPVFFQWEARAPVGSTATDTTIYWDSTSHPGTLGTDAAPTAVGYPNFLLDYRDGSYALPRSFTGAVTFPTAWTYSYRAHAVIDGKHYWSPEYSIVVQ